jgi:hypothetical protein
MGSFAQCTADEYQLTREQNGQLRHREPVAAKAPSTAARSRTRSSP